jgi:hypothetical protein
VAALRTFLISALTTLFIFSLCTTVKAQTGTQEKEKSPFSIATTAIPESAAPSAVKTTAIHPALVVASTPKSSRPDFNQENYYLNRLELSIEGGWFAKNVPFPFDFLQGGDYTKDPLAYTLAPVNIFLRWHLGNLRGPRVLRGNWEATFGVNATPVPRGPEARFFGYTMGIRRNFVPRRWHVAPYLDGHVGMGHIDARAPFGIGFAQGQDMVFSMNLGSGLRYNINPRYSVSLGVGYMHISNMYLSEPKYFNYGINVIGPQIAVNMRLGRERISEIR